MSGVKTRADYSTDYSLSGICQSPFLAGDPSRAETMLITDGCDRPATLLVRRTLPAQQLERMREGVDRTEAVACTAHANALRQRAMRLGARPDWLHIERITEEERA